MRPFLSTNTPPPEGEGAGADAAGCFGGAAAAADAVVLIVAIPACPMHALAQESLQTMGHPMQAASHSSRQLPSAARGDDATTTNHSSSAAAAAGVLVAISDDLMLAYSLLFSLHAASRTCFLQVRARRERERDDDVDKIGGGEGRRPMAPISPALYTCRLDACSHKLKRK